MTTNNNTALLLLLHANIKQYINLYMTA